jgi:hypothetical protein
VSDYTPTKGEILWANIAPATGLATFTTEASLMGGILVPNIPAGYFLNNQSVGRTLKLKAYLKVGSTTTGPTMQFSIRIFPHGTAFSAGGGILLGTHAALTMQASQTLAPVVLEADMVMDNVNEGATSVLTTFGEVRGWKAFSATAGVVSGAPIPDNNVATNTVSTYDRWVTYDLYLSCTCGTSNAANTAQLFRGKLYAEN